MIRNKKKHLLLPTAVMTALLLLMIGLFPSVSGTARTEETFVRWQLPPGESPSGSAPETSFGFAGLSFSCAEPASGAAVYGDAVREDTAAQEAYFCLTEDSETGIQYAYVPAEMNGPLQVRLHEGEQLVISEAPGNTDETETSGNTVGTEASGNTEGTEAAADLTSEAGISSGGPSGTSSAAGTPAVIGTAADRTGEAGAVSGTFFHGDTLPVFAEGVPCLFTILDAQGQSLGSETVIFYYTENVPSMYVETASGSMKAIDADKHHETSEEAVYRIYQTDGTPDSSGTCRIKGRGNSTWSQKKRPYNLNFDQENILLDMSSCRKYALIANFWDSVQTRQYYAFLAAERLGLAYTPQTRFVNLYLNGKYQSLYLLTQRINVNGGTVQITNLDKKNKKANPEQETPDTQVMDTDEKGNEALAYTWQHEPADITGGYLLEINNRYNKEDVWFTAGPRHITFKSPEEPSIGEYAYISEYVREAEAVLFASEEDTEEDSPGTDESAGGAKENASGANESADGTRENASGENESAGGAKENASGENESAGGAKENASGANESVGGAKENASGANESVGDAKENASGANESAGGAGRTVWDYFDMDSWARMFLIQDFFVQSDDEYYSFYFYKKTGDPLLYCGPVWDFDLCLGNMNCGDYYRTSAQTLWLKDGRKRWLHQMYQYPEFRARVAGLYLEELEPVIRDLLEHSYDRTVDLLEKNTNLNYLRWHKNLVYRQRTDGVRTLLQTRVQFLHDYYTDPGAFHRLLFHFAWDDFSYYVRDGESMGFLPTSEYGEKQSNVQEEANGFIIGWADEDGNLLEADTPVYEDMEFTPVYQ